MKAQPILYRGTVYPSKLALARALGVTHQTIAWHINNGSLDRAGVRDGKRVHHSKRKPVTLPTISASPDAIRRYLEAK